MLNVKLFGPGQAWYDEQPLAGFPQQQASLLLCYLLLHKPYPLHREHLASIFWPDDASPKARKCLCNALWRLRQMLLSMGANPDEYIFIHDETISFRTTSRYLLDVDTFEELANACLPVSADELTAEQVEQMEGGVHLYIGDLLESVYEDWCLYERERLHLLYLHILNKLMLYYGLINQPLQGLVFGNRILANDPLRENVQRQMMWLYWLAGDRNAALSQYKHCVQILWEELKIRPMPETQRLYEQILINLVQPDEWLDQRTLLFSIEKKREHDVESAAVNQPVARRIKALREMLVATQRELRQIEKLIYEAGSGTNF